MAIRGIQLVSDLSDRRASSWCTARSYEEMGAQVAALVSVLAGAADPRIELSLQGDLDATFQDAFWHVTPKAGGYEVDLYGIPALRALHADDQTWARGVDEDGAYAGSVTMAPSPIVAADRLVDLLRSLALPPKRWAITAEVDATTCEVAPLVQDRCGWLDVELLHAAAGLGPIRHVVVPARSEAAFCGCDPKEHRDHEPPCWDPVTQWWAGESELDDPERIRRLLFRTENGPGYFVDGTAYGSTVVDAFRRDDGVILDVRTAIPIQVERLTT